MLIITDDDGLLLGTLVRDDLPGPDRDNAAPALQHAVLRDRTIAAELPATEALRPQTPSERILQ